MSHCGCDSTRVLGDVFATRVAWILGSIYGAICGGLAGASAGPFGVFFGAAVGAMKGLAEAEALGIVASYGVNSFSFSNPTCKCSPICLCNPLPDPWSGASTPPARVDPLVLDLNRDGKVELKNAAFFDLNANGFHEFTRWIDKTDAFLVLDKNFNGKADNGSELFGDVMTLPDGSLALTGFDALRAYDSNGDGKIDASDEVYASLKVLTGEGKMASLADAGIKSLNVASEAVNESTPPALSQSDLAKLTWDERVLALKDQAREADRALWKSGGSVRAQGTFECSA